MENATHVVKLGGEERYCNLETYESVCGELVAKHGGIPKVELVESRLSIVPGKALTAPAKQWQPVINTHGETVSDSGKARSLADAEMALENGFAPAEPIYAVGTQVNELGVENARRSQMEHDAKPWATEVCEALYSRVKNEDRIDLPAMHMGGLRMSGRGFLVMPTATPMQGAKLAITGKAFNGLMSRYPCASGAAYLGDCPTRLRSINFNHWSAAVHNTTNDTEVVIRTRENADGDRIGFAAVSPRYTPYDADQIAEALGLAFPSDAKGSLNYDGERVRVEGLWHTDVEPEEWVAGEFFKAGVIVTSDDTGGGSIRVRSVMWRNLCLNLIILDAAIGVDVRIRHTGNVGKLAEQFKQAFSESLSSVDGFRRAWGAARQEEGRKLIAAVQGTTREDISSLPVEAALPGIFAGILKRDLVPIRGRADKVVPKLLEMHRQDELADTYGVSRASVVNAFTRYAHQVEADPFQADRIRQGAGKLLSNRRGRAPAPLPYEPIVVR